MSTSVGNYCTIFNYGRIYSEQSDKKYKVTHYYNYKVSVMTDTHKISSMYTIYIVYDVYQHGFPNDEVDFFLNRPARR